MNHEQNNNIHDLNIICVDMVLFFVVGKGEAICRWGGGLDYMVCLYSIYFGRIWSVLIIRGQ